MNRVLRRASILWLAIWATAAYGASPVYIGANYGVYKSTDAGANWTLVDIPLNNPLLSAPISVFRMAKDPHDSNKFYFTAQAKARAFFATADGGQTWTVTPFVGMAGEHLDVDFAGQVVYIDATGAGGLSDNLLYKSTDRGVTWSHISLPNTTTYPASSHPYGVPVSYFVVDPFVSGTLYAYSIANTFLKSTDFGQTWTQVASGLILASTGKPLGGVQSINPDPWNRGTWYDTLDFSFNPPSACPLTNGGLCGLFKSSDGAATFTGMSIQTNYVTSVAFSGASGTVYAAGDITGLGPTLFRTTDGGATWTPIKNGLFSARSGRLWGDITDSSTLWVSDSAPNRVTWVSTDGASTFRKIALPQGPPGCKPGACVTQETHDILIAPVSSSPVITSVVNGASLLPGFAPNSWVTIYGSNLASTTDDWTKSIVNGNLPTSVDGTSVMMGGQPAYVYFVSSGQLNVLAPNISPGPVSVTVTTAAGTSPAVTSTASQYSPAIFTWPGNQPVATRQDFSFAVKAGTFAGATTTAAKPGDVLILWTTGLGPTTPAAPVGVAVPGDRTYATATAPTVTINNAPAIVFGAALAPGAVGVYQIAIQVPNNIADGDWPIQIAISGSQSPSGVVLSVHK